MRQAGRHFLQIPGPSPVPDRILRAIDMPVVDHRGPGFADLGNRVLTGIQGIFKVNTMCKGDKLLMVETGHFASLWQKLALKLGLQPEVIETDWRRGADPDTIEQALRADTTHSIKALCVVHNETSTGSTTRIAAVRRAMDAAGHPALLLVDTISGLASADFQFDDWGVDVAVSGSQKGLMLPPGLSFNAVSKKALAANKTADLPKAYWQWDDMVWQKRLICSTKKVWKMSLRVISDMPQLHANLLQAGGLKCNVWWNQNVHRF